MEHLPSCASIILLSSSSRPRLSQQDQRSSEEWLTRQLDRIAEADWHALYHTAIGAGFDGVDAESAVREALLQAYRSLPKMSDGQLVRVHSWLKAGRKSDVGIRARDCPRGCDVAVDGRREDADRTVVVGHEDQFARASVLESESGETLRPRQWRGTRPARPAATSDCRRTLRDRARARGAAHRYDDARDGRSSRDCLRVCTSTGSDEMPFAMTSSS
jgi:hypothetical protein